MLSGIKKGKKKSKKPLQQEAPSVSADRASAVNSDQIDDNLSVADRLRRSLASGDTRILEKRTASKPLQVLERLEQRSLFQPGTSNLEGNAHSSLLVVNTTKISTTKREEEMTARELALNERNSSMSWDDQMLRNAVRVGKKRSRNASNNDDSDDELEKMKRLLPQDGKASAKASQKAMQRERHRQIDEHLQQEKITSKCSWWINSKSFSKHRLLAMGNHVSLVMAPPNSSLIAGHHFYLVPLKHASSFVECDDDGVWEEVRRFRNALNNMFATKKKGIIMLETVLPNNGLWQTKLDIIGVPFSVLMDSPIFFKSSMIEASQEWGTHNKLLQTTAIKPLKNTVPKGFPYFFVDWGNVSTSDNTGYAQIIEASDFRHDFGFDTLSSMMDLDPIRFQRKKKFSDERESIAQFLESWKKFDWTAQLE